MCNRDCFNCTFDDCVIDEATPEEKREINKRNGALLYGSDEKYEKRCLATQKYREGNRDKCRESNRKWRKNNPGYMREYRKRMTEEQKARKRALNREYKRRAKEKI